jgi:peptide/nickel transport system ATP-binding protein
MGLDIRGLSIAYRAPGGDVAALSDVSLTLGKGRTLAVVGESGSGKTTIAMAVMGLLPAEAEVAGRILFQGIDVLALSRASRRRLRGARMALVFQDPYSVLNPAMRIGEQIGEGLVHHRRLTRRAARARAIELLDEVGIGAAAAVAAAYPHELSGGMRQRALIAGALAAEPELLILDEPTTALDVTIEAQILDLLEELRHRRQLTTLLITHNLGVVRRFADDIAVLYAGQVVEQGATLDVLAGPLHPYSKGLLAALPRLGVRAARLASIEGRLPDLRRPGDACRFQPRCPFAVAACARPQALAAILGRGVRCHRASELVDAAWPIQTPIQAPIQRGAVGSRAKPAAGAPLVKASGLVKSYTLSAGIAALSFVQGRLRYRPVSLRAVDACALSIAPGEVLGLVGESGAGKSTLGKLILRLERADGGSLEIAGQDVTRVKERALGAMRRTAQIVFQNADSSLNPSKTVAELIGRPLRRFAVVAPGQVATRVRALLELVRLPAHYAERYPHQLSGGEKQRIGIARALATEPRFILCDEPVSALDVSVQAAIVNLLADLRDRLGVAYLFISHDIAVVAHLADRIAVMYRGKIVEEGSVEEIVERAHHPYTQSLLAAVPALERQADARMRLAPDRPGGDHAGGCPFARRCPRRLGDVCERDAPPVRRLTATHSFACHHDVLSK